MNQAEFQQRSVENWKAHIDQRWQHINRDLANSEQEIIKYLFLTNAGGAASVLTYIATLKPETLDLGTKSALALFTLGIILVGFMLARSQYFLQSLQDGWDTGVREFYKNFGTDWKRDVAAFDHLVEGDYKRSRPARSIELLAWAAFLAFIAGVVVGMSGVYCS